MLTIETTLTCEKCGKEETGSVKYQVIIPSAGIAPSIFPKQFFGEWILVGKRILCDQYCRG
jgi:hypothetical protein